MIQRIGINNYKSFYNESNILFENLNIITGENSSGKSSVLETLIILKQKNETDFLNGHLKTIGDKKYLINNQNNVKKVNFKYGTTNGNIELEFNLENSNILKDSTINFDIIYLSAERVGVKDLYEKKVIHENFDPTGNTLVTLLEKEKNNTKIGTELAKRVSMELKAKPDFKLNKYESDILENDDDTFYGKVTFIEFLNFWMDKFTGYKVEIEQIERTNFIQLKYKKADKIYTPMQVGTGVTFVLFQLIATCLSKDNSVILVENPEIHLHPKLQSQLMYFYLWCSRINKQIIIETHSDHIFNACRYFKVVKEKCKIYFLENKLLSIEDEEVNATVINDIEVDEYGDLIKEHENLFDQYIIDIKKMLGSAT